jgi:hypothetical protein
VEWQYALASLKFMGVETAAKDLLVPVVHQYVSVHSVLTSM